MPDELLHAGRRLFESDRVSDSQTLETIKSYYKRTKYILDPHSAVGVTVANRSIDRTTSSHPPHISMSTAHPAKFAEAVQLALKDEPSFDFEKTVIPPELGRLAHMEKRVTTVENSYETVKGIVERQVLEDIRNKK